MNEIIRGLQETVSASRLNLFLQCRLKFYFRYVAGIQKPKTAAVHVGRTVHSVLKAWNKARWRGERFSVEDLHRSYLTAWSTDASIPDNWEEERSTGWRLLETYFRESTIPMDEKPDAVEVPVQTDLGKHGLPTLCGVIDLVQRGRIIDFKTTSTTPNAEKAAHINEAQTSVYAVLYRDSAGKKEQGIEVHHLVKLKNPRIVITPLGPMSDHQQTRLFHLIDAYVAGLDRRDFIPSPGHHCANCEYFNECRAWK